MTSPLKTTQLASLKKKEVTSVSLMLSTALLILMLTLFWGLNYKIAGIKLQWAAPSAMRDQRAKQINSNISHNPSYSYRKQIKLYISAFHLDQSGSGNGIIPRSGCCVMCVLLTSRFLKLQSARRPPGGNSASDVVWISVCHCWVFATIGQLSSLQHLSHASSLWAISSVHWVEKPLVWQSAATRKLTAPS